MAKSRTIDLTGKRFGMLTVLEQTVEIYKGKRQSVCRCLCDCGRETLVPASRLARRDGTEPKMPTRSCGCSRHVENLTGRRIGRLTVLRKSGTTPKGGTMYLCRCECGNEKEIAAYQLASGDTKSCGCLLQEHQKSFGRFCDSGVFASHTPAAEAARYQTNHRSGSGYIAQTATRLEIALSESLVMVDNTNVPALINPQPLGNNPYRGVCWNKQKNCWMAYCTVQGRRWRKYGFKTPEQAKEARDKMQSLMIEDSGLEKTIDQRRRIQHKKKHRP